MPVFKSNLTYKLIRKLLKENYNIDVTKIKKIKNGSANLYNVYSLTNHYVLKEYQDKFDEKSIIREYNIFECLKKQNFSVPEFIKSKNDKICIEYNDKFISLQKYIDGTTLNFYQATKEQLIECAVIYAEILKKLEKFDYELPKYSLDLLNQDVDLFNANGVYSNLIKSINMPIDYHFDEKLIIEEGKR